MVRTNILHVKFTKKAQTKIQEMAFVLVAIIIFFAIVGIFYIKIGFNSLGNDVETQRAEAAMELVRKIAATPEFALTKNGEMVCDSCIDTDKVMALKNMTAYKGFWNMDFFRLDYVYPVKKNIECVYGSYPDCSMITLSNSVNHENPVTAYVSLCRSEYENSVLFYKCEMGKVEISAKGIAALGVTNVTK